MIQLSACCDKIEDYIRKKINRREYPYALTLVLILVYLVTFLSYRGFCDVSGTTEAISVFEPVEKPETLSCNITSKILIITGLLFLFLVPGYIWTVALFRQENIDVIERMTISFALSISLIVLTVIYLNMVFKIKITRFMIIADVALIALAGIIYDIYSSSKIAEKKAEN